MAPDDDAKLPPGTPRYALTEGIKMDAMRRAGFQSAIDLLADRRSMPRSGIGELYRLPVLSTALRWLHLPEDIRQWQAGRYHRILLDDLFERFKTEGLALLTSDLGLNCSHENPIGSRLRIDARIRRLFSFRSRKARSLFRKSPETFCGLYRVHRLF
ncbi:MAG: hypothetical protein U0936_03610 [Planctomycetaceae bacterium]